jgi:hypothetical protein
MGRDFKFEPMLVLTQRIQSVAVRGQKVPKCFVCVVRGQLETLWHLVYCTTPHVGDGEMN